MKNFITDKELWGKGYQKKESIFTILGRTRQNAVFRETVKYIDNLIKSNFIDTSKLRILELGGGNSDWLCYFGEKYNCELWAIDYSEMGCELLSRKLKRKNLVCKIINKDFYDINSSDIDRPLDLIFSFGLLEHFSERKIIYDISSKYLNSKGLFISVVPNLNEFNLKWCLKVNPSLMSWHISLRMSDILEELESYGFQDINGIYIGGLRLFADTENLFFSIIKKSMNLIGELISRFINISDEMYSPYYIVSGKNF